MADWVHAGLKFVGQKEIPGVKSNAWIRSLWQKAEWLWKQTGEDDSKLPWCGAYVAECFRLAKVEPIPKAWYRAKEWLNWGEALPYPCFGCVVVFTRTGGGHVGFCVGKDKTGRLLVLGGNQADGVSIAPFDKARVTGYRMPKGAFPRGTLPVLASNALSSLNEA
jgi:uncharacterized protein (TIGR02594 family)